MRTRTLSSLVGAALSAALLLGCGVARDLTTRTRTYAYTASLPPVPANTTEKTQYTIDEAVENTYHKYHGGVDWTRVSYRMQNSSAVQPVTLKLYASLKGDIPAGQLDQQATLFETVTLSPSENSTLTPEQAPKNDLLRQFLATALSQGDVTTVYFYGTSTSSDSTAMVTISDLTTRVQVHGSYF